MTRNVLLIRVVAATVVLAGGRSDAQQATPAEAPQAKTEAAPAKTESTPGQTPTDPKAISGMSILGNQEAPKALVIVPWKDSELGASMGISTVLDDSKQPVDKDVFMRALRYYEIRSETTPTTAPRRK